MTKKFLRLLASLKLAVFTILSLAVIAAVGTIIESKYDADAAAALVYRSVWMYLVMGMLSVNLISVMIDRWPWQKKHTGFVCAHIGILILLSGGLITQKMGIDGSMYLPINGKSQTVNLREKEIVVYSSFNGQSFAELYRKPVDFLTKPANQYPLDFSVMEGKIKILDSMNYVNASERFVPVDVVDAVNGNGAGLAIRFQIQNDRTSIAEWLYASSKEKPVSQQFGPLRIFWGSEPPHESVPSEFNALYFQKVENLKSAALDFNKVKYTMVSKDNKYPRGTGVVRESESFQTPWMGFKVKILRFIPHAKREWDFKPANKPTQMTTAAIKVQFQNQEQWVQLGDIVRFFTDKAAYILKFGNQSVDIGEEILLKKFNMGTYQGTRRAMSYESLVEVPQLGERLISMNEPLKYKNFTFYQSSFESSPEDGRPTASILSVNYDPGRFLKYLGSLIMVFGIMHLFWWKKRNKLN